MTPTKEETYILREDVEKILQSTIHKYLYELNTTGMEAFDVRDDAYVKYCEAARAYFGNFTHSEQSEETLQQILNLITNN